MCIAHVQKVLVDVVQIELCQNIGRTLPLGDASTGYLGPLVQANGKLLYCWLRRPCCADVREQDSDVYAVVECGYIGDNYMGRASVDLTETFFIKGFPSNKAVSSPFRVLGVEG